MADGAKDEKVKQAQLQTLRLVANDYWKTSGKLGASDAALWKGHRGTASSSRGLTFASFSLASGSRFSPTVNASSRNG